MEMLPKVLSDEEISEAIPEESEGKAVRWRVGSCSESVALLLAKSLACLKETREAGAYRSWQGVGVGGTTHKMRLERGSERDHHFKSTGELLGGFKTRW